MLGGFSVSLIRCCRYHHCCKLWQVIEELEFSETLNLRNQPSTFQKISQLLHYDIPKAMGEYRIQYTSSKAHVIYSILSWVILCN